ncbi:MAG: hypothetical protein E4H29_02105 [Deltaproteobacteria bacterium]|nr:MAG: hypothetical protein E4H29_02105 [Deltaproteobacteria bacterium]
MKTNLVRMAILVLAAATLAAPAFAGENPAMTDFEMQWGMQNANPAEKVDAGTRPTIPDAKVYKYRSGIETGNLPSDAGGNSALELPKEGDGGG